MVGMYDPNASKEVLVEKIKLRLHDLALVEVTWAQTMARACALSTAEERLTFDKVRGIILAAQAETRRLWDLRAAVSASRYDYVPDLAASFKRSSVGSGATRASRAHERIARSGRRSRGDGCADDLRRGRDGRLRGVA